MTAFKIVKKEIEKESIGSQLKKTRTQKNLTFEAVEEVTKIRIKYLKALENENWDVFSASTYAAGFLKSYCHFLEVPADPILTQYKRERGIENNLKNRFSFRKKEVKYPKIYITPTLLLIIFLVLIFLGVFVYIGYQVSGFASAPYLAIESPNYGATITQSPVSIEGKISKGASLYINGQLLSVDADGNFKQEVKLEEGSNNVSISATNRIGKKTDKELILIYQPQGP
ncbi:MAG: helix-turn-helix domain-containing protein [Candidatus Berkelbacteria bacterium]|nr:helix-turn-helix domain-containing protein [Candidatus Berkelbacteria bacterium]